MSEHKLLKIMIVIISFIILLIIGILVYIQINSKTQSQNVSEQQEETQKEIARVENRNDFFTVANCVDKYVTYLTTKEKEILYGYLDEEYKTEKGITVDNIFSYLHTLNDYYKFRAREMYVCELENTISQYFVYGTLTLESTVDEGEETPFYISVKLDKANNTFSIIPDKYIDELNVKQ